MENRGDNMRLNNPVQVIQACVLRQSAIQTEQEEHCNCGNSIERSDFPEVIHIGYADLEFSVYKKAQKQRHNIGKVYCDNI